MLGSGMRLGREYEDANLPLAVRRLSQAGMRLSEVLNDCLSPEHKKTLPAPHFRKEQEPALLPAPPAPRIR